MEKTEFSTPAPNRILFDLDTIEHYDSTIDFAKFVDMIADRWPGATLVDCSLVIQNDTVRYYTGDDLHMERLVLLEIKDEAWKRLELEGKVPAEYPLQQFWDA